MEKRAYSWKIVRIHGMLTGIRVYSWKMRVFMANTQLSGNEYREYQLSGSEYREYQLSGNEYGAHIHGNFPAYSWKIPCIHGNLTAHSRACIHFRGLC